jgi:drug/metabolite transporter (DMT)-like permease
MFSVSRPTPVHLLVFATSFAMVGICTALALRGGSTPLTVVTVRWLGTLALFAGYFTLSRAPLGLTAAERRTATLIAIPLCVNNYCLNAAIAEIPVPLVVLIFYLWPALTTCASWMLRTERFRWSGLAGLALAFTGVALAVNADLTASQSKGVLLALTSACTWSLVFLLMHRFFRGRDTRAPTLQMALTAAAIFVVASALAGTFTLPVPALGRAGLAGVAFFYALGMIGIFTATAKLGPARTGFYMNFEPIAAVLLSALLLGQTLAPVQLAGAALVILALFLFRPPAAVAEALSRKS